MFRLILTTAITVVAGALVAVCLASDVLNIWLLSFIYSFRIHLGALTIAVCVLAYAVHPRNLLALLLVFVAVGSTGLAYMRLHSFAPTPPYAAGPSETPNFRLVSFNVLGENRQGPKLAKIIQDLDPDIAIILEANAILLELPALSRTYPYRLGCGVKVEHCDSLILSKTELQNMRVRNLSKFSQQRMLIADTVVKGVPMRVVSAHMTKPYYDGLQRPEVWEVIRPLLNYEGNLLLAGDFNSSLLQPAARRIPELLDLRTGPHEPATWPIKAGRWGIAIDHILARPPFVITATRRIEDNSGSNHYGLYADIYIPGLDETRPNDVVAVTP